MPQLILYACPIGPLAAQIGTYFEVSQRLCGPNAAHAYMPHCTLTGFFEDEENAIALYTTSLERVLATYQKRIPEPPIFIEQIVYRPNWHGLELKADWLKQLASDFVAQTASPTRRGTVRLKDWLHLSLAYEFDLSCEAALKQVASDLIDLSASVSWQLHLYQRSSDNTWQCHSSQALG